MSLSLAIYFKDGTSEAYPFSFESVLTERWRPLAKKLQLAKLERLGFMHITDPQDAAALIVDLGLVRYYLNGRQGSRVPEREYMLKRISEVTAVIEQAITNWDHVESISL